MELYKATEGILNIKTAGTNMPFVKWLHLAQQQKIQPRTDRKYLKYETH